MTEYTKAEMLEEFAAAREQFEGLVGSLSGPQARGLEHAEVEELIHRDGTELLRRLLQGYLDLRRGQEERQAQVVGRDGQARRHCRSDCRRSLMSLFGEVQVRRKGYSGRGLASEFVLDEALNLPPDKYSHGLRERVAQTLVQMSFEETVKVIERSGGGQVPKRQVEELSVKLAADFDAYYAAANSEEVGEQDVLVLSFDGKGVVMRTEGLREGTRKAAERAGRRLKTRLRRGEKPNRKRMAQVAAVYDIAPQVRRPERIMKPAPDSAPSAGERPKPRNKRAWASLEREAHTVIDEAFAEALRRDPDQRRPWVVLVDGQESQLRDVYAAAERHGVKVTVVQDFIHVLEYLWKAAYSFHPEGSEQAEQWVMERATQLLRGKTTGVAAGMRRSATRQGLLKAERKAVDKCAAYLHKNRARLAYDQALAAGFPIATGVIEGACRHLVKDRMDITGARWGLEHAEAVLKLRSLHVSGDLHQYFAFHRQQERARHYQASTSLAA